MKIVIEAQVDKISSRVDGTVIIQISSQELDNSNAGNLFALRGKHCKVLLSDSNISSLEEELVDSQKLAAVKKNKTESQRLRAILWLSHSQSGASEEFDVFYKNEMEKIISIYKSKLD